MYMTYYLEFPTFFLPKIYFPGKLGKMMIEIGLMPQPVTIVVKSRKVPSKLSE